MLGITLWRVTPKFCHEEVTHAAEESKDRTRLSTMGSDITVHETCKLSSDANYGSWNFILENILRREDMWRFLETKMAADASEEERRMRQRALSIINLSIHHSLHQYVRMFRDPYDVWNILKSRYASSSSSRKIMLLQKLLSLKMNDTQKMDEFFLETRSLVDQLGEIALALPEELISIIVLNALPKVYKGFVQSLVSRDELPPWGNIEAKLISKEIRLKHEEPKTIDGAMAADTYRTRTPYRTGERPRYFPNHRGRAIRGPEKSSRDFEGKFRETNKYRTRKCDSCGQPGHWERECPIKSIEEQIRRLELRKRDLRRPAHPVYSVEDDEDSDTSPSQSYTSQHDQKDEQDNPYNIQDAITTLKPATTEALLTEMMSQDHDNHILAVEDHSAAWYLDSGASNHVTGNRNLLVDVRTTETNRVVHTAGGQSLLVKGVGSVVIKLPNGEIKTIGNILYVLGLTKNLFSVGLIADKGLTIHFSPHACHVIDKNTNQTFLRGIRDSTNSLYRIEDSIFVHCVEINVASQINQATLWHARLGHPNEGRLHTLVTKQLAHGLPTSIPDSTGTCEACIAGKQSRLPFSKTHISQGFQALTANTCKPLGSNTYPFLLWS